MIATARIAYLQERIARYDDQLAYKELFLSFCKPLKTFAFNILKHRELAEEAVSDVFIKIWEQRKRIDSISNLRVYLYVATKNVALNYLDREHKSATRDLDQISFDLPCDYLNPEQLFITGEMLKRIKSAIDALPPQCKMVFKLVKEDELKYKEVAEIMNISIKTVENQMTIAIRKLGTSIRFDVLKAIPSPGKSQHP